MSCLHTINDPNLKDYKIDVDGNVWKRMPTVFTVNGTLYNSNVLYQETFPNSVRNKWKGNGEASVACAQSSIALLQFIEGTKEHEEAIKAIDAYERRELNKYREDESRRKYQERMGVSSNSCQIM